MTLVTSKYIVPIALLIPMQLGIATSTISCKADTANPMSPKSDSAERQQGWIPPYAADSGLELSIRWVALDGQQRVWVEVSFHSIGDNLWTIQASEKIGFFFYDENKKLIGTDGGIAMIPEDFHTGRVSHATSIVVTLNEVPRDAQTVIVTFGGLSSPVLQIPIPADYDYINRNPGAPQTRPSYRRPGPPDWANQTTPRMNS